MQKKPKNKSVDRAHESRITSNEVHHERKCQTPSVYSQKKSIYGMM